QIEYDERYVLGWQCRCQRFLAPHMGAWSFLRPYPGRRPDGLALGWSPATPLAWLGSVTPLTKDVTPLRERVRPICECLSDDTKADNPPPARSKSVPVRRDLPPVSLANGRCELASNAFGQSPWRPTLPGEADDGSELFQRVSPATATVHTRSA